MNIKLDKHDIELIYQSICYFDMYEDGNYEKWFGKDADKVNESFHYLYSLCNEHRGSKS